MISLVIKGSWENAKRMAIKRGIVLQLERCNHDNNHHEVETIAWCNDESFDAVNQWFGELPNFAPYPNGSLLLYRLHY